MSTCLATLKNGEQCSNPSKYEGYCGIHKKKVLELETKRSKSPKKQNVSELETKRSKSPKKQNVLEFEVGMMFYGNGGFDDFDVYKHINSLFQEYIYNLDVKSKTEGLTKQEIKKMKEIKTEIQNTIYNYGSFKSKLGDLFITGQPITGKKNDYFRIIDNDYMEMGKLENGSEEFVGFVIKGAIPYSKAKWVSYGKIEKIPNKHLNGIEYLMREIAKHNKK